MTTITQRKEEKEENDEPATWRKEEDKTAVVLPRVNDLVKKQVC